MRTSLFGLFGLFRLFVAASLSGSAMLARRSYRGSIGSTPIPGTASCG